MRYFLFFAILMSGCAMAPRVVYVLPPVSSEILVRNYNDSELKLYYGDAQVGAIAAGDAGIISVPVSRPHCYYDNGYRDFGILQMEMRRGSYYYCQPQKNYTIIGKINNGEKLRSAVKIFNFSTGADYPVVEFSKWDFARDPR